MRYRKLDDNGDYVIGHGNNTFHVDTPETVAQAVSTRLGLLKGEWYLDTEEGTVYPIGAMKTQYDEFLIRERILTTPGVSSLETFYSVFDPDTRALTIHATIVTQYGTTSITQVLPS